MVAETTPDELREKLVDDDELVVIDIRDPSSHTSGHIPGSENLPAMTLGPEVFDRERPAEVVVSCYVGKNSKQVASVLDSNVDADVSSPRGGFDAWDNVIEDGAESEGEADLGPTSPF